MELVEKQRKTPKRLLIELPEEWHQEIKVSAANKNISIKTYVLRAVIKQIKEDKQYE